MPRKSKEELKNKILNLINIENKTDTNKKTAEASKKDATKNADIIVKSKSTKKTSTIKSTASATTASTPKSSTSKKTSPSKSTTVKSATKSADKKVATDKTVATKNAASKATTSKKSTTRTASDKDTTTKSTTSKTSTRKTSTAKDASTKTSATRVSTSKKAATKTSVAKTVAKKSTATKSSAKAKSATKKSPTKKTTKSKTSSKKAVKKEFSTVEYYDLPYRYNETVVKILAQTPNMLFIYWDISDDDRNSYIEKYGENFFNTTKPVLIITNKTMNYSFEVEINDFANSWYLHINDANCDYAVELGRRPIEYNSNIDNYIHITTSNDMQMPNDHILFDKLGKSVFFKNVKNNYIEEKEISSITFIKSLGKVYDIYELYKEIYNGEINIEDLAAGNTKLSLSSSNSSTFK